MKPDIIKQFNLPGYIKGKSFADASKAIDKKFKDRTDPYAQKTKEELLERLAEAQEYVKMKEQAAQQSMQQSMDNNAQEVPDEMEGQIPQGMEEFMPQQQQMAMGGIVDPIDPPNDKEGKINKYNEAYNSLQNEMNQYPDPSTIQSKDSLSTGFRNYLWLANQKGPSENIDGNSDATGLSSNRVKAELFANELKNRNKRDSKYWGKTYGPEEVTNQKQDGGFLSELGAQQGSDKMKGINSILGAAGTAMEFGQDLFGKTGIDTSGNAGYMEKKSEEGAAASGALKGAAAGAEVGGAKGAIIGGVIGGASKFFGSKRENKDIEENNIKTDLKLNNQFAPNTFAKGGYTNKYDEGGYQNKPFVPGALIQPDVLKYIQDYATNKKTDASLSGATEADYSKFGDKKFGPTELKETGYKYNGEYKTNKPTEKSSKKTGGKVLDFLDKNKEDLLRISPVAYNLFRANNLDEAEVVKRQTLDNKYNPQYMDVNQMLNEIDQNNVNKALSESSGGNLGALRSSILAANLNKDKAKSQAYAQADQVNRSEDSKKQQFDTQIDKMNLSQENQDLIDNMQNRGARETAKRNLEAAGISQLGQIGKEAQDRKIAAEATGYKYNGEFIKTDDGTEIKPSELNLTEKDGKFYDEKGYELSEKEVAERAKNYKKKE